MDQLPRAVEASERALALAKETGLPYPKLLLEHADSLLMAGEYDLALAVADQMTVAAHQALIRARVAQERGDPARALEYFEDGFRLWPDNPWARYYGALAAEAIGDFDRATEAYRNSLRIAPGATDARQRLARLHLAEGRPIDALLMLRMQADKEPGSVKQQWKLVKCWCGTVGFPGLRRTRPAFPDTAGREFSNSSAQRRY